MRGPSLRRARGDLAGHLHLALPEVGLACYDIQSLSLDEALTVHLGTRSKFSGKTTYQDLANQIRHDYANTLTKRTAKWYKMYHDKS